MNGDDEVIGEEEYLLSNATTISLEEVPMAVDRFHGACYPAHIDREANGIIAVLGTLPDTPDFKAVELHFEKNRQSYKEEFHLEQK